MTERKTLSPAGMRRRSELMDAAVRLAARNGFTRTRVSDIVGRVGVGQGVFYWYFESKEALFREIMADNVRRLRLFQAAFIAGEPDPVRRIAKGIVATMEFIRHNRHVFGFLDHSSSGRDRFQRQRIEERRAHVLDMIRHIEQGIASGRIAGGDPELLAQAIGGAVDRLGRVYLGAEIRAEPDALAQAAIDFCVSGLLGGETFDVADLRADVAMTPALLDLRDRVGAGSAPARA